MFIGAIVLGIIALLVFLVSFAVSKTSGSSYSRDSHPRRYVRVGAAVVGSLAVLLLIFSSFAFVGTKQFGVVTSFGRPVDHLSNGLHSKAPWEQVHTVDGTIQTDTYASDDFGGDKQDGADGSCVKVRIALNGTACVNVSFRWQNQESGVDYLYKNFKGHDAVRNKLVLRDLQTAVNATFSDYNPLDIDAKGNSNSQSLAALSDQVRSVMRQDVGQWIDVQSVLIPIVHFDPGTQNNLNAVQAQVGKTRAADQAKNTATAQALANTAISNSISHDPNVLEYQCLTITQDGIDHGHQFPAAWNCTNPSNFTVTNK